MVFKYNINHQRQTIEAFGLLTNYKGFEVKGVGRLRGLGFRVGVQGLGLVLGLGFIGFGFVADCSSSYAVPKILPCGRHPTPSPAFRDNVSFNVMCWQPTNHAVLIPATKQHPKLQ